MRFAFRICEKGDRRKYSQRIKRGKEIRLIKSHIRVGVIIGIRKDIGKNIVIGVKTGKAYESEVKIAKNILDKGMELKGEYFIGDKSYDSIELIKEIERRGIKPAIKVKETFRVIESVFGNIKRGGRDYFIRILLIWLFKIALLNI
ncbi:MAG: transposase, partial [Brevinematia bacterium]